MRLQGAAMLVATSLLLLALSALTAGEELLTNDIGPEKELLFSIAAHSGQDAVKAFRNKELTDFDESGTVYRSEQLNDLKAAVRRLDSWEIVVEMRKNGRAVASATFDVSRNRNRLTAENWFTPARLIKSYPYWIGKRGFLSFSIKGMAWRGFKRTFYIMNRHGGCPGDIGFMGIGWNSQKDPCRWVNNGVKGRSPVFWYSTKKGVPYARNVHYADQFLIYLKISPTPFIFGYDNALLFAAKAHSGKNPLREYRNVNFDDSLVDPSSDEVPDLFRSSLLNNLPRAIRDFGGAQIVVEMRKNGRPVASATFDALRSMNSLNAENWFTPARLITSYPYWIGKGRYLSFSIKGMSWRGFSRLFYIMYRHAGCPGDAGFMGIGWHSRKDPCRWASNGVKGSRSPVFWYSTKKNVPYARNVHYADQYLIYIRGQVEPYMFERNKALLFTVKAHSGKNPLREYRNTQFDDSVVQVTDGSLPSLFRSSLLNNLAYTVKTQDFSKIVIEMRKNGRAVASATFDVSRNRNRLTAENWFTPARLIKSYPYWIGKRGFLSFSIKGMAWRGFKRTFYIMNRHGGCPGDIGFMGIGWNSQKDPCRWVNNGVKGRSPVFWYSTKKGVPYARNVHYADRFLIYLKK